MLREDYLLGPFKRVRVLVVGADKVIDALTQLPWTGKARSRQGVRDEDAEPDLHLIEPRRMGRNEVQVDVLVPREPAIMLRFMSVQIVEDNVQLPVRILSHQVIHEIDVLRQRRTSQ